MEQLKARIEAVLFTTAQALSIKEIADILNEEDVDKVECTSLVTSGKFYSANTAAELANSLSNSLNARKEVDAKIVPNY